jgi:aspartyl-tRNA(Asn)/glutamyl-tRNA(Gln) amidotransferase subunit A
MPDLDAVNAAGMLVTWGDVIAIHGEWMKNRAADYTPQTRGRIEVTLGVSAQDYGDALRFRGPALLEFAQTVFSKCDVVVAPVLSYPVPKLSDVDVSGGPNTMRILNEITRLMRPVNFLGLPALSVPGGFTSNGLPCGFQIIGRPFAEPLLYRVGAAYEKESGLAARSPVLQD